VVVDVAAAVVTTLAATRIWSGLVRPLAAAAVFAGVVVAAGAIAADRFDGVVALVLVTALLCITYRRLTLAGGVLGIGFALKLMPVALVPFVFILAGTWRKTRSVALAAVVAGIVPFVPFLVVGAGALASGTVKGQMVRGLQIESVAASPYLVAQVLQPGSAQVQIPPGGSLTISGAGSDFMVRAAPLVVLMLLVVVYVAVWRARRALRAGYEAIPVVFLAAMLAAMIGNKVLSPQHLLWLLPFVALCTVGRLVLARMAGILMVVALVLTQVEFPGMYLRQMSLDPVPLTIIAIRNAVLVAAFTLSVIAVWRYRGAGTADAADAAPL
jgi:hypothetical protein